MRKMIFIGDLFPVVNAQNVFFFFSCVFLFFRKIPNNLAPFFYFHALVSNSIHDRAFSYQGQSLFSSSSLSNNGAIKRRHSLIRERIIITSCFWKEKN